MTSSKATNEKVLIGGVQATRCFAVIIALALMAVTTRPAEQKADAKSDHKLVGTWKLLSAKHGGEEHKFPEGITTLKRWTFRKNSQKIFC